MNPSILITGGDAFASSILSQVRGLSAFTILTAASSTEVERLLEPEPPVLLLLQASRPDTWKFCRYLKRQRQLSWIYCILLDDRPFPQNCSGEELIQRQMSLTTTALEAGADAYLWLPNLFQAIPDTPQDAPDRLLQAQIRVGLARVQSYRELSRANDLLSAIALVDPLTELSNRRAFNWELPRQIQTAREQGLPLSLLILDLDHFKTVNDRHGHLVGDDVLRMMAERLRFNMRFYEMPFRYGGEEFVVILNNTDAAEALVIGQRLRSVIGDNPFSVREDLELRLTVSIGIATLTSDDDDKGLSLLERADTHLLTAKVNGRNRVIQG